MNYSKKVMDHFAHPRNVGEMDDANAEAIYTFYRAGILTGSDGKGTFNPNSSIKRSEVAAILSRMFDSNVRQSVTLN